MSSAVDYHKQRVLLIDSSSSLRSTIRTMLTSLGFSQVTALTLNEGVLKIIAEKHFDIVLLGHNVHDRYSGLQLLEQARYQGLIKPTCSWLLMTSDPSRQSLLLALEVQPDELLIKPFTLQQLRVRLESLCQRRAALATIETAIARQAPNRAIRLCDSLFAASDPYYRQAQLLKGRLLMDIGDYVKAEALFEQVGQTLGSRIQLARCRFHLGKQEQAKSLLDSLISQYPLLISAYDLLAQVHEAQGNLDAARETLVAATLRSPLGLQRQLALGRLALGTRQLDLAEQAYRKSVQLSERSCLATPEPYLRLANVQRLNMARAADKDQPSRLAAMERLLLQAQRSFADLPEVAVQAQLLLAQAFEDLGQQQRAKACTEQAQQLAADTEPALDLQQLRQQVLANPSPPSPQPQPSPASAAAADEQASILPPADPLLSAKVNRIGVRHYLAGKADEAMRYFSMAVEHDNSFAPALLNLAQLFFELARDDASHRDEQLRMFQRYLQLAGQLTLTVGQQQKYKQLNQYGTMLKSDIPDGSLGNLLK